MPPRRRTVFLCSRYVILYDERHFTIRIKPKSTSRAWPRLSRIFRDNLSRIFTRPPKTLGEKYSRAGPKPVETFRPSRPGLRPRHETLRVTKGHENARPSVVSDKRRCQAAQAASGNANSRGRKGHLLMFLMWAKRPFSLIALGKRSAFIIFFIAVFLSLAIGNIVIGNTSTS